VSRARALSRDDTGAALVEFLGVTVLMLVPIVYAVLAVGQVQAATYAVEGASRTAARGAALAALDELDRGGSEQTAHAAAVERASDVVSLALEDFAVRGLHDLVVGCGDAGCGGPGSEVVVEVEVAVPLPGIPGPIADAISAAVPVSARGTAQVDLLTGVSGGGR